MRISQVLIAACRVVLLALLMFALPVRAESVTLDYSFSLDTVDPSVAAHLTAGDTGSGQIIFDPDDLILCTSGTDCTNPGMSVYHVPDTDDFSWEHDLGPWSFTDINPLTVSVYDGVDFGPPYGVRDGIGLLMVVSSGP
ncbi:MAG: hypothetical protein JRC77_10935, partial [Deltaproteobacteria bacterium]|nr:hypothetical protein [Deltaproteobacteria bacterium]